MEIISECPELLGSPDYALGFRDGFVDYVYAGGNGEPPPVPPRQYWNVMLRSPEGKQLADAWFAGYRHGAQIARDGGYRDLGTIRTSLVSVDAPYEQSLDAPTPADPHVDSMDGYGSQPELLPEPQATPNRPALPAPQRPPVEESPVDDDAGGPLVPPQTSESAGMPSMDSPNSEADSAEQPQDLPLPNEELLGDPFQSDGASHEIPAGGSERELANGETGRALTLELQGSAASSPCVPALHTAGSTIRLLASPTSGPPGQPKIVVQLDPTPVSQGASQMKEADTLSAAEVQLTAASAPVVPPTTADESTIRIRNPSDRTSSPHPKSFPIRTKRKPTFVRQTSRELTAPQ
jgi:hypothetical protein